MTYTTIQGWMIHELKLKGNELILYAIIYGFSQDRESEYFGSLTYIQNYLLVSRHTVIKLLRSLLEKKLIIKTSESHYIASKETLLLLVQKLHHPSAETAPVASAETAPNIYNTNNKSKDKTNSEQSSQKVKSGKYDSLGADVIKAFEAVDAKNKTYYGNKTQRASADFLISEYGFKKVGEIIGILSKTNKIPFFPKINSPYDLKEKWQKLSDAIDTEKAKVKAKKSNVII